MTTSANQQTMHCSRCGRPMADDMAGLAICCAGATRQWRCAGCSVISEGFAFAYGRCPHCGDPLLPLEATPVDSTSTLEAVRMAFEIELGGRAFYQRAAADSSDPAMRALFGRFAVMEGAHMETLARRYHLEVPASTPALRLEVAALFADVTSRPEDPANLFRIAIALEDRAAAYFSSRAASAPAASAEQQLFRELAAEELEHAQTLATAYWQWRVGKPGLLGDNLHAHATAPAGLNAVQLLIGGHAAQRPALRCGDAALDYGALRGQVARAAAVWVARGVTPGQRIAVKLTDGIDWVVAFLGSLWAGAVAVAVNPRIPAPEWHYILDEAGFHVILAEHDDDTPEPWRSRVLALPRWRDELMRAQPIAVQPMAPDAPAFWCHSSGTSGKPKAVVHAHRFAGAIEQVSREGLGIGPQDRLFASSKMFFAYPQTNALFAGLKLGAEIVLDPQWPTAAGVAATVAQQRPSVLLSVPSLYRNLLHEGLARDIAGAGVRLCVSAGEALPASLREQWQAQTGLTIVDGYGASEALVLVMLSHSDAKGFVPSPGVGVQPLDDVPDDVPTRLMIRAPTLALGYLDRPQAQAETFRDGAFCPADLWVRNARGGWRFAGREDSLVKIGGRWVNLIELADKLLAPGIGVVEGAAVCVPDRDGVDAVAFFYVVGDGEQARATLLARSESLPHHQRPRWLHAVDSLPRGPTGKLLRRRLQELHRERV